MTSNTSSNSSSHPVDICFSYETGVIIASYLMVYILLTPLFFFVLVVGYQKWRKQRLNPPFTSSTHLDILTYNVVVMELLCVLGNLCTFFGTITEKPDISLAGIFLLCIISTGHMLFHLLTCVERYLAVVHPILYLQLRGSTGVTIRNIIIGCVWLISLFVSSAAIWLKVLFETTSFVMLFFTSVVFSFCSFFVIIALINPGPGEGGRNNIHTKKSKHKAFQTMVIITGVLSLRFIFNLLAHILQSSSVTSSFCLLGWLSAWFSVPSSLVLPLLFLQRVGKLKVCEYK